MSAPSRTQPPASLLLALALALAVLAQPARGEEPIEAARRIADVFAGQLAARKPPLVSVSVAPLQEHGFAREAIPVRVFQRELSAALARKKLAVPDWAALDAIAREQALGAITREQAPGSAAGKGAGRVADLQALVVGEALGGAEAGAPLRVTVRLVQLSGGAVLAAEVASLPGATAAAPAAPAAQGNGAPVDVAVRRLADQLAAAFQKRPEARYQRVAVLGFAETGDETRKRELGAVVSAELATALRRDHGFLLVERAKLKDVLGEMRLSAMGLVDASSAARLGKLADAQALVLGTVAAAGDRFLVNARIVATESAETVAAAAGSISAGSLVALSSEAVVLRSRKEALFRSMLVPGWGQFYNREPVKGWVVLGGEVALLGGATAAHLLGQSAESRYRSAADAAAAQAARRRAEDDYRWRSGLLLGAAGLWVLNVADAWLSGVDGDRLVGLEPRAGGAALVVAGRF